MTAPDLAERADERGWIASTPADHPLRFAVIGASREEATQRFMEALERWESLSE